MATHRLRLVFGLTAALSVLILGGWVSWSTRTVTAYRVKHDLPRYHRITTEDLTAVDLAASAARSLEAVTDREQAVGHYTALPLRAGTLLTAGLLLDHPPCADFYPSTGRCLPPGREAIEVPIAPTVAGILDAESLVNVWAYLPSENAAQVLLQKHPVLAITGERVVLALTPDEVAALAPYLVDPDRSRLLYVTLTTPKGPVYRPLQKVPVPADEAPTGVVSEKSFRPPLMSDYLDPYR